ncbi:cyclopropane fatty acyl phospholipid synthase [Edaphobacter sp.]|uniref:cyclopropane fatty acyl phospholipid synthase n=1 Tax=Edaphobacter sp. TaxID=1934404 RepID=UPI002DBDF9C4|nr:cyclopropane fatty acyl phospholipid synthase [Edaphobacter sp.]HEU5340182.1 cyclopropane fatty acyl phospholipid synthase [Edaphobacter sp.]
MDRGRSLIEKLFAEADVWINGRRPWDIHIHDERFFPAVLHGGVMAFGESYMAGWWDTERLDELAGHLTAHHLASRIRITPANVVLALHALIGNLGSKRRAFKVGEQHYNLGNDLFERMLDRRMTYSCGYWLHATTLDQAQEAKLDLVCRKLGLRAGQRVLDIGCGWGSFARFAAENYGVTVTGITVSAEQMAWAREHCAGLPVEFRLQDYRDVHGSFDHIVSIGMFEHVGYKNYRAFMKVAERCLKDDGIFLLHSLGRNTSASHTNPWIHKYIFPNGMLPSIAQIGRAFEGRFVMEDWHNFGAYYDNTLMAWFDNFNRHWPDIAQKYGSTFYRMWKYYLLSCAGTLRAREAQLWQIALSKHGVPGGYQTVR